MTVVTETKRISTNNGRVDRYAKGFMSAKDELKRLCLECNTETAIHILRLARSKGYYDVIEYVRDHTTDESVRETADKILNTFLRRLRSSLLRMKKKVETMETELGMQTKLGRCKTRFGTL